MMVHDVEDRQLKGPIDVLAPYTSLKTPTPRSTSVRPTAATRRLPHGEPVKISCEPAPSPPEVPGVITTDKPTRAFATKLIEAIGWHRHWNRASAST
jgi:hypothetical protein